MLNQTSWIPINLALASTLIFSVAGFAQPQPSPEVDQELLNLMRAMEDAAEHSNVRAPTGKLTNRLGHLITIEGIQHPKADSIKGGARQLLVDTVNGKKLPRPVAIHVNRFKIPPNERCILKGFEDGKMVGTPPAVFEAARELGKKVELAPQTHYHWSTQFYALIVVEPRPDPVPKEPAEPSDAPESSS